ncbi:MAG: GFA family protein [Pseudomonadota bacterium]
MKPPQVLTGGCQCERIRYQINASPRTLYVCHCTDCQKQSSSAFGMSLIIDHASLQFTAGEAQVKYWDTHGDDGALKRCAFCENCGTRLFHAGADEIRISIKAGSLDDTRWLQPVAQIWRRSAQTWLRLDGGLIPSFDTMPDDESALTRLWKNRLQD